MALRVLTWNLMHGRAIPGAGRELLDEFAAALRSWDWDVALLQEVPPWWPSLLGSRVGAASWLALTSRNGGLAVRRFVARRWPDLIKSNGGGCNAILVRRGFEVDEHRVRRLRRLPERRVVHAVLLTGGVWLGNVHGSGSVRDADRAARAMLGWSGSSPLVLGGDFNIHSLTLPGLEWVGGYESDHVLVRGLEASRPPAVLARGRLSDHAPVVVTVALRELRRPAAHELHDRRRRLGG